MACFITFFRGALVHFVDADCLGTQGGDSDFLARSVLSATNSLRARAFAAVTVERAPTHRTTTTRTMSRITTSREWSPWANRYLDARAWSVAIGGLKVDKWPDKFVTRDHFR